MMTLGLLEKALAEKRQLEVYEGYLGNFEDMEVCGIIVRRKPMEGCQAGSDITLHRDHSGTGSITGMGFSAALGAYLTEQLNGWFHDHISDAKKALQECGVDVSK